MMEVRTSSKEVNNIGFIYQECCIGICNSVGSCEIWDEYWIGNGTNFMRRG